MAKGKRKITIKETAGKMLLYFYQLQRTVPMSMPRRQLGFIDKPDGDILFAGDKQWLTKDMRAINPSSIDILNAYTFLVEKKIIESSERIAKDKRIYVGVHVTAEGVDLVEGIEQGKDGQSNFMRMFNIAMKSNVDVERLIKDNLKGLFGES